MVDKSNEGAEDHNIESASIKKDLTPKSSLNNKEKGGVLSVNSTIEK